MGFGREGFVERKGFEGRLTGPIALNSVNSNTFSIADFEGSRGGGLTSVGQSAIAENDLEDDGRVPRCCCRKGAVLESCDLRLDMRPMRWILYD